MEKCEYCGQITNSGWQGYFRLQEIPENDFLIYNYYFCCRGHYDAFLNQTRMKLVNKDGYTTEETEKRIQDELEIKKAKAEFNRTHDKCNLCGYVFLKGYGINSNDNTKFCSEYCEKMVYPEKYINKTFLKSRINTQIDGFIKKHMPKK